MDPLHIPPMPGVVCQDIATARLTTRVRRLEKAPEDAPRVLLVHGNLSSSVFWEELILALGPAVNAVAMDLRGYGDTRRAPLDATRGLRDFTDDLAALVDALGWSQGPIHLVGWSVGGGVVMQYALDHIQQVASLVLICPMSPYGFGATKGLHGAPCHDDFAGSGGGLANPELLARLKARDTSADDPSSPRSVMGAFYFHPPFRPAREEAFLASILSAHLSDQNYPGDSTPSAHWPFVAPGTTGINNALSPKYCNVSAFGDLPDGPPVLWVRGADDQIVSDASLFDPGTLGSLGLLPGWPGKEVFPSQPMIGQTRRILDTYQTSGGTYREVVFEKCGHSPHIEHPQAFVDEVRTFWNLPTA